MWSEKVDQILRECKKDTHPQKPGLEARIEGSTRKKKVVKVSRVIEEVENRAESWVNVKSNRGTLIEELAGEL